MFARALRKYRKGFVWLTVLFGLLMVVCSFANAALALAADITEMQILRFILPKTSVLLSWAGWAYAIVFGIFSLLLGANVLGRELRRGTAASLALLPVSRSHVVLTHYAAGLVQIVLSGLIVSGVTFGSLYVQNAAYALESLISLSAPVLCFGAVYSLTFAISMIVKNAVVPALVGSFGLLASALNGVIGWHGMQAADQINGIIELAEPAYGSVHGLFVAYGTPWGISAEALLIALVLIMVSLLVSLAVFSKKSL